MNRQLHVRSGVSRVRIRRERAIFTSVVTLFRMKQLVQNPKRMMRKFQTVLSLKYLRQDLYTFDKSPADESFVKTPSDSVSSSNLLQLGIVCLLVLLVLFCIFIYRWRQDVRLGPKHWPIIGCMFFVSNYNHIHDRLLRFLLTASTICAPMPFGCLYYCTTDPANLKHLLDTNSINYFKGNGFFKRMEILLGQKELHDSFLMRKWTSSEFSQPSTADMSARAVKKSTCSVARILSEVAFEAGKVDMQELLRRASLDAAGEVALGIDFASVPHRLRLEWPEDHRPFSAALDSATEILIRRFGDPLWELKRCFKLGQEAILPKQIKVVNDFIYNIISDRKFELEHFDGPLHDVAQAYQPSSDGTQYAARKNDLITNYLTFTNGLITKYIGFSNIDENSAHVETEIILRDIVVNFMVASRDATAATLTWFVYMMSQNASVAHKLYEELREFHARKRLPCDSPLTQGWDADLDIETYRSIMATRIGDYANLLTNEAFQELPYLHACIQETLRLYPIVPLDPMDIDADDILPDGYKLKGRRGNMIFIPSYSMARLTSIWGPDAASFNPQRWLQKGKFVRESEFKFVAFQGGLYTSSVKDLIYGNCKVAAAIIGRFFEFVYSEPSNHLPGYRMTSALFMANGLNVYARLRD